MNTDSLGDDEIVVAVDMSHAGEDLDDWEEQLKKLGAKRTAECFMKARQHFETTSKADDSEEKPPPQMTLGEWREQLGGEEGEEEEALEESEEEESGDPPELTLEKSRDH